MGLSTPGTALAQRHYELLPNLGPLKPKLSPFCLRTAPRRLPPHYIVIKQKGRCLGSKKQKPLKMNGKNKKPSPHQVSLAKQNKRKSGKT